MGAWVPVAVLAYPVLKKADRAFIEGVRMEADPNHRVVAPHFTLAFPAQVAAEAAIAHAREALAACGSIAFVLRSIRVVPGRPGGGAHVFLVAQEGAEAIVHLHRALYAGPFGPHLRPEIPFVPHVTIGAHGSVAESERLAGELRSRALAIEGHIERIDVVEARARSTPTIATIALGG